MQTFPFARPAKQPGLYKLEHQPTKRFYVGSSTDLRQRFFEWRAKITSGGYARSDTWTRIIAETDVDDWAFVVLRYADASDDIRELERQEIARSYTATPDLLLNTFAYADRRPRNGSKPLSTVTLDDGTEVSYTEAAFLVGCSYDRLTERLARRRARGVTHVRVSDLIATNVDLRHAKE